MTAPELYAISQESKCEGKEECHWCGSPCKQIWLHDDTPNIIGQKRNANGVARPGNHWICIGCWLFNRQRISIRNLNGLMQDCQAPVNHSWWITNEDAISFSPNPKQGPEIYKLLLKPPIRFCLTILDGKTPIQNKLYHSVVNDLVEIKGHTPLHFTVNNIPHKYTIYELEETLKRKSDQGKEPGVRALLNLFGRPAEPEEEGNERGRYSKDKGKHKILSTVAASGKVIV